MRQWVEGGVAGIVVGALMLVPFDQVPAAGWLLAGSGLLLLVVVIAALAARRGDERELPPASWFVGAPRVATPVLVPSAWFAGAPRVARPLGASGRVRRVAAMAAPPRAAAPADLDFAPLELAFFAAGEALHEHVPDALDFADLA